MNTQTYTCQHCNCSFERVADRAYHYCSRKCYHASKVGVPTKPRVTITHHCAWCETEFYSLSSAGARSRFCSRSCQAYASIQTPFPKTISSLDAAYLAGIVDGEGCIMVLDRTATRKNSTRPTISLTIGNTYLPLLQWIASVTGCGSIESYSSVTPYGNPGKDAHTWRLTSISAACVLKQIKPFLLEKRGRAEAAIAAVGVDNIRIAEARAVQSHSSTSDSVSLSSVASSA